MPIHVRLKPHDPTRGHTARGMTFAHIDGVMFEHGKIVASINGRPISKATADYLRGVRMKQDDPLSPLAFDVLEEKDMRALVAAEGKRALGLSPEVMSALRDEFGGGSGGNADPVPSAAGPDTPYRVARRDANGALQLVAPR